MKIGHLWIPHFRLAVTLAGRSELLGQPVVIGGLPTERKTVLDASPECRRLGVRAGLTLRQAEYLCPEATFLPDDTAAVQCAQEGLVAVLGQFSPIVEPVGLGAAAFDAAGLEVLFGPHPVLAGGILAAVRQELGLTGRLGIAPARLVAALAARTAADGGWTIVGPTQVSRFLAPLPVGLLPLGELSRQRLAALGIRTAGQFLRLPGHALSERIGPDAYEIHRALSDRRQETLRPTAPPTELTAAVSLEGAIETRHQIQAVAKHLLADLVAALDERHQACRSVRLCLELEDGRTVEEEMMLKTPAAVAADLVAAVMELAERAGGLGPLSPPVGVRITLGDLGAEIGRQLPLLHTRPDLPQRRARLERALGRIERRFGDRLRRGVADEWGRFRWEADTDDN
ncbi:MAG: hypothetical protein HY331_12965 [Chloroflexi bacterium]|nr:hypothetical protein [Chloroflexota bacterium]